VADQRFPLSSIQEHNWELAREFVGAARVDHIFTWNRSAKTKKPVDWIYTAEPYRHGPEFSSIHSKFLPLGV
jgi:hypothetical protein